METEPLVAALSPPEKPPELACTLIAIGSARAVAGSSSTLSARIGQSLLIDSPASLTSTRRVPRAGLRSAMRGARVLIRRKDAPGDSQKRRTPQRSRDANQRATGQEQKHWFGHT